MRVRLTSVLGLAFVAGLLVVPVAPGVAEARADECPAATPYPGDNAPKADIAVWMARGAAARGLPGELPVMAALVESGLSNLNHGDGDAKGYFQMRESIWSGTYPGFPGNPELQLDWFLDQATTVRVPPYPGAAMWGEWVADVQRPAAGVPPPLPAPPRRGSGPDRPPVRPAGPLTEVSAPATQKALKRYGIRVSVSCPAEQCTADVRGRVLLGKRPKLAAPLATLAPGQEATFKLRLKPGVRRLVAQALKAHERVRVRVTVTTTGPTGSTSVDTQRVRITG